MSIAEGRGGCTEDGERRGGIESGAPAKLTGRVFTRKRIQTTTGM
jgi:hypothetical protein